MEQQNGIVIRSSLQVGYMRLVGGSPSELDHNTCLSERDLRTLDCIARGWPQDNPGHACYGNNSGKMLDTCMSEIWDPPGMAYLRPQAGKPYISELGDKCFDEYMERYRTRTWSPGENEAEWARCLATVP